MDYRYSKCIVYIFLEVCLQNSNTMNININNKYRIFKNQRVMTPMYSTKNIFDGVSQFQCAHKSSLLNFQLFDYHEEWKRCILYNSTTTDIGSPLEENEKWIHFEKLKVNLDLTWPTNIRQLTCHA